MNMKKVYQIIGRTRKGYVADLNERQTLLEFVLERDLLPEGFSILSIEEVLRLKKEADIILHSPYQFSDKWEVFLCKLKRLFGLNMVLVLNADHPHDIYIVRCFKATSNAIPVSPYRQYILE